MIHDTTLHRDNYTNIQETNINPSTDPTTTRKPNQTKPNTHMHTYMHTSLNYNIYTGPTTTNKQLPPLPITEIKRWIKRKRKKIYRLLPAPAIGADGKLYSSLQLSFAGKYSAQSLKRSRIEWRRLERWVFRDIFPFFFFPLSFFFLLLLCLVGYGLVWPDW